MVSALVSTNTAENNILSEISSDLVNSIFFSSDRSVNTFDLTSIVLFTDMEIQLCQFIMMVFIYQEIINNI